MMRPRGATYLDVLVVVLIIAAFFLGLIILGPLSILGLSGRRHGHPRRVDSCSIQARQIVYAATAYANDWRDFLPTRSTHADPWLFSTSRLPIIGFDTTTGWHPDSQPSPVGPTTSNGDRHPPGLGGLAHVLRDYLKNDWRIVYCWGGWTRKDDALVRDYFHPVAIGYQWLPHRVDRSRECVGDLCSTDKKSDIAQSASQRPWLLVIADFAWRHPRQGDRIAANHLGFRNAMSPEFVARGSEYDGIANWPTLGDSDSACCPPGSNVGRLDGRVTWRPWEEVDASRYVANGTVLMW